MAVSATWIRNNMLFSSEQYDRQLTEAELKVQRSLQKLSIPDWYLNKRSNPPKILNVTPIECRPPSWKNAVAQKDTSLDSVSSNLSGTLPLEEPKATPEPVNIPPAPSKSTRQQKSSETKHKRTPSKGFIPKEEIFDTSIPEVKLPTNISKTFPKVSPSRKIQNINLVFPPGPKMELDNDIEDVEPITQESKYKTFVLKKETVDSGKKMDNDSSKNDVSPQKSSKKKINDSCIKAPDAASTPLRTPHVKTAFKIRAASTPKFTPANLFSSTIIEESPKGKKTPCRSILEKSSIFENSSMLNNLSDSYTMHSKSTPRRKLSQSLLEKTSIFENSSRMNQTCRSCEGTPVKVSRLNWLLERNIRSIDPILFEKDDKGLTSVKASTMVREIVKRLEIVKDSNPKSAKERLSLQIRNSNGMVKEKQEVQKKQPDFLVQEKKKSSQVPSPCTRFLNSRRKSTDLENVVKSKQGPREKSVVREIIETLTEKLAKTSLPRQAQNLEINQQNFVKKVVNALEKGDGPKVEDTVSRRSSVHEEDSYSESEGKSCTTSASHKDTDSSSDTDHRSPSFKSDDDQRFDYSTLESRKTPELDQKALQEDDSVYWIPVSRCKLPRTSSLLSMMSRLSGNTQSPCVSPIRCESEADHFQSAEWGATYRKTNGLSRKLFRIDETTVLDSGYSDRSDRSGVGSGSSLTDSTWSEDTQHDSGSEIRSARLRRSSRRKSIVGHAICIH